MVNMAILTVTTVAVVTAASAARLPRAEPVRVTSQDAAKKFKEVDVTCVLEKNCTLPCSFEGQIEKVYWYKKRELIPIECYPKTMEGYQHHDFKEIVSLSVNQATGDASLLLRGVQTQHQGTYSCSPTTSNGTRDTVIRLTVHTPVGEVQLQQKEQKLICRAEGIYPQPNVTWAPSTEANTTVNQTESGLYNILSSVTLPDSPAEEYSCSVSTPHSSETATVKLQRDPAQHKSNLHYLWILLGVLLIAVVVIIIIIIIICCCKKRCKDNTPSATSGRDEEHEETTEPLNPLEVISEPTPHAGNGQLNGHVEDTSV